MSTPAATMSKPPIRPYKRPFTSALHKRFLKASSIAFIACYIEALVLRQKVSCEPLQIPQLASLLTHDLRVLGLVSHRPSRHTGLSTLLFSTCRLHATGRFDARRLPNHHVSYRNRQDLPCAIPTRFEGVHNFVHVRHLYSVGLVV